MGRRSPEETRHCLFAQQCRGWECIARVTQASQAVAEGERQESGGHMCPNALPAQFGGENLLMCSNTPGRGLTGHSGGEEGQDHAPQHLNG